MQGFELFLFVIVAIWVVTGFDIGSDTGGHWGILMAWVGTSFTGFRWYFWGSFIGLGGEFRELGRGSVRDDSGWRVGLILSFILVNVWLVKVIIEIVPEAG